MNWGEQFSWRVKVHERYPEIWDLKILPKRLPLMLKEIRNGEKVLDIGASTRELESRLKDHYPNLVYKSMDIDRKRFHDFYHLDEIEETFDVIFLFEVIEHLQLEEGVNLLRRLYEFLNEGGRLILTTPNIFNPSRFWRDATHQVAYCYDELGGLLLAQGFRLKAMYRIYNDAFLRYHFRVYVMAPLHRYLGIDFAKSILLLAEKKLERRGMRVIFLTHSSDEGQRFRVGQYFPFLKAHQIEPRWQPISGSMGLKERLGIYRQLSHFDVVCIQRRLLSPFEFYLIRRRSSKVLFDLDDAIMYRSSGSRRPHSFSRTVKFRCMVRGSDVVTVGNQFLMEEVFKVDPEKEVHRVPTSIDTHLYPKKKKTSDRAETVLGWIGTRGNLRYLQDLEPSFEALARRFPRLQLKIVSDGFPDACPLPLIKKVWRLEDENDDLVSFDIGLMPLRDDLWSKGKCGVKIIQYLSVGVPAVCTPVGVNRDIVANGHNGFWAATPEEWVERITTLIENSNLRENMGAHGIEKVEREYSLSVTSQKFLKVLQGFTEKGA